MRVIGHDTTLPRQEHAVASGALANGKPVVINADGTVSVVGENSVTVSVGSHVTFGDADVQTAAIFDSTNNKVVIAYGDEDNNNYGTAVVGNVSGTTISFGTPVVFTSASITHTTATFDTASGKVVIACQRGGTTGGAVVGTVSGTSISFGSFGTIGGGTISYLATTFDSAAGKVVVAFRDNSNSNRGTAVVGTVSGTSISYGSFVVFETGSTQATSATYDTNEQKVVIAYRDDGNSNYGKAVVGTVSGTSISFGSPVTFEADSINETAGTATTFDSTNNKVVIVYGRGDSGRAIVGTISGTSISFGSFVAFSSLEQSDLSVTFDATAAKVVVSLRDPGDGSGKFLVGTVSGTNISFGSATVFETGSIYLSSSTFDSNLSRVVFSYGIVGGEGYAVVLRNAASVPNLTSENYIGMSSGVVDVTGTAGGTGSETVFEQATSRYVASAYDTNTNRVVIAYADNGNSQYGTAIVGTVSGTSISFGSPVVFETAEVQNVSVVFDSNSNKIVIAYADEGNSSHGTAIVGTVSGTAISFGSAVVFEAANSGSIVATFDSNSNKAVIAYQDLGNSNYGTAIVGTVSGTGISFGTAVVFEQAEVSGNSIKVAFDSSSNKIVIVYRDSGNSSYGTAIVGTVSGTGISFGTAVVFNAAATHSNGVPIIDTDNNKVIISYKDNGNSNYGTARVGTVSGTGISFGTAVVFNSGNTELYAGQAYHPNIQRAVIGYRDDGDSNIGKYNVGTISGTDISFTGEVAFNSGRADNLSLIYDPDSENLVMSFEDNANSSYGTSLVFTPSTLAINRGEVPSGSQAITNIIGSVSSIQTGLTAGQSYFVQTDGTIGLTADDPSVFAGTAISATKLLVKT